LYSNTVFFTRLLVLVWYYTPPQSPLISFLSTIFLHTANIHLYIYIINTGDLFIPLTSQLLDRPIHMTDKTYRSHHPFGHLLTQLRNFLLLVSPHTSKISVVPLHRANLNIIWYKISTNSNYVFLGTVLTQQLDTRQPSIQVLESPIHGP